MAGAQKKLMIGCLIAAGALIAAAVVFLLAIGIALEAGYLPDTVAQPAGKIHARYISQLTQMKVVGQDERVLYFYSAALFSIRNDGNLFTDKRVIAYQESSGELDVLSATYDEIESIDFESSESWIDDSWITVTKKDGTFFVLYVSTEANGDKNFYNTLNQTWQKKKGDLGDG